MANDLELQAAARKALVVLQQLTRPDMSVPPGQVFFEATAAEVALRRALMATAAVRDTAQD